MRIEYTSREWADQFWEALDEVARERCFLIFLEGPEKERTERFIDQILSENWTQYFAIDEDRVVGWCDIVADESEGFRHVGHLGMGVIRSHRRRGIGEGLLRAALDDAFAKGLTRIEMEAYASNTAAIALYEKLGFRHEGRKRGARVLDGVEDDIVVMGLLKSESVEPGKRK